MSHNSKIITMFAVLITKYLQNAGCQLAFTVQAFFMPGHIVYHIWYPCTPVWSVNAPTAFCRCDKQRERHGYFHFKHLLLCLTIQKLSTLLQTATKRPPTKRVLLLSPLPAILTSTLPLTTLTSTDAAFAIYVPQTKPATQLPDVSTSPDAKKQREQLLTKVSSPSWLRNIRSIAVTLLNANNVSASVIIHRGCHAIRNLRYTTVTAYLCSHFYKLANYYPRTQPTTDLGRAGILHPKIIHNQYKNKLI